MNDAVPQPTALSTDVQVRATPWTGSQVLTGLMLLALCGFTAILLVSVGPSLVSWETVPVIALGIGFLVLLYITLALSRVRASHPQKLVTVVWWFLLCSQHFFARAEGGSETSFEGRFSSAAYAEGVMWVLALVVLVILTLSGAQYLRQIFSGPYKWLSLYGILCLLSTVRTPRPAFTAAWAFKLCIVVLVIQMWSSRTNTEDDIQAFLRATFWGFAFLAVGAVVTTLISSTPFEEGRLGGTIAPDGQSELGANFLLLSLTLHSLGRRKGFIVFFGALGIATMILPGGKAAIAAGIFSAALFFLVQKRLGSVLGLAAGSLGLGTVILASTPLAAYLHVYHESGQLSTLTGRTDLWKVVVPAIGQSLVWGHGFMGSRFFALQQTGTFWEAGHTHNAFLEVLYNNGLVGLTLILVMNAIILKNLVQVIRRLSPAFSSYRMAVGCLVIYINIVIDSLMNANFGGRVAASFMMLIALVAISDRLVKVSRLAQTATR